MSVIHAAKGAYSGPKILDGQDVETISAFLFHSGGHDDPERLEANARKSFQGSIVLGMGFTFDDTDRKGVATPLAEMRRLIEESPRNQEVICPVHRRRRGQHQSDACAPSLCHQLPGLAAAPRRSWARHGGMPTTTRGETGGATGSSPWTIRNPVAADWPSLLAIVEEKRNQREMLKMTEMRGASGGTTFRETTRNCTRPLLALIVCWLISRVSQQALPSHFCPRIWCYAESMIVFPFTTFRRLCALQSRPHEIWARFFGSSMKDDLRYTPSDCFETFPFPENWESCPALEAAGEAYYDFRAALMVENNEGLTKTYNRFHDPDERDPRIARLRQLHAAMDRVVLDAYGWTDIRTDCEFLLDYEIDEETWGKKKKPWRYRWPDEVRDEVLARLFALNAQRAVEERMAGSGIRLPAGSARVAS